MSEIEEEKIDEEEEKKDEEDKKDEEEKKDEEDKSEIEEDEDDDVEEEQVKRIKELKGSSRENVISETYELNINQEFPELSNEFCTYYHAVNMKDDQSFLAIVFQTNAYVPIEKIDRIIQNPIKGLNRVHDYGIVKMSNIHSERLAVIVDFYKHNNTLSHLVDEIKKISSEQVESVVAGVTSVMSDLKKLGIFGINIKPKNIIMKEGQFCFLREFFISYPNYFQETQYVAPEIMECHPAGRFVENVKPDIYALGVTVIEAHKEKSPWNDYKNEDDYNYERLEEGSIRYLIGKSKVTERIRILLRWCLHDDPSIRWDIRNLSHWVNGKAGKAGFESINDKKNITTFKDKNFSGLKSLAYSLFNNWNEALNLQVDSKFIRWATKCGLNVDGLESIKGLETSSEDEDSLLNRHARIYNLIELFKIIDPNGAIRTEKLAFSASSAQYFLHYAISNDKKGIQDQIIKYVRDKDYIHNEVLRYSASYIEEKKSEILFEKLSILETGSSTKTIERVNYDLNPKMPCLSKVGEYLYINSIAKLILALDDIASRDSKECVFDKQIIGFMASKLDFHNEIKLFSLPKSIKLDKNPIIKYLGILNILQKNSPKIKMKNVSHFIVSELKEVFEDYLHNANFKKEMLDKLNEVERKGELNPIMELLLDQKKFLQDYNNSIKARVELNELVKKIELLEDSAIATEDNLVTGRKITLLLSYGLCFLVAIVVMW